MRSSTGNRLVSLFGAVALLFAGIKVARADVFSDEPAAILVMPEVIVDTEHGLDTLIQISNASDTPIEMKCFYVNATPTCGNRSGTCITSEYFSGQPKCTPSTQCIPQWVETDFHVVLTRDQPVAWLASIGAQDCLRTPLGNSINPDVHVPCFPLDGTFRVGAGGQSNAGSSVPPVAQDPFIGELKCVAINTDDTPAARNDLFGHVTVGRTDALPPTTMDVSGYNAIGIQALQNVCQGSSNAGSSCAGDGDCPGGSCVSANNEDQTLVLGRPGDPGVEYNGCPNILILDHFFDFAVDPVTSGPGMNEPITTDLTLVPCSEDFLNQQTFSTTVQFLVFNEFEQRFSTSRQADCLFNVQLSNIDTATNNRSIFSAQVMGTLTGQTRIRGVVGTNPMYGNTLVGIAEEFHQNGMGEFSTGAFNLHAQGVRPQMDFIYMPGD